MAWPWFQIIDTALGIVHHARRRREEAAARTGNGSELQLDPRATTPGMLGGLETRLAGVMVAAIKEAFDRDTRRLELEREQVEAERRRAEKLLHLELLRQAADREVARLRLLAGIAVASAMGSLVLTLIPGRLTSAGAISRGTLIVGWLLLLTATAAAFAAQAEIGRALQRSAEEVPMTAGGKIAPWLIVAGLALVGAAVLI